MERTPIKSSNIKSVRYDAATKTMHVEFVGGKVYEYPGVPEDIHAAFASASSLGSHFAQHIRPLYLGRKLEK